VTSTASPLGSTWRKWDLHVHTPESIVHLYRGPDPWDRYLSELSSLPPQLSVIGINDYLFVDGYRRVLDEFQQGRLPNLEAIFPVIELRLTQLAGVGDEWHRINYHVIFEEQFNPDVIESQFVNGLSAKAVVLSESAPWSGMLTIENLTSFGASIRTSLPDDQKLTHNESDLKLGFNNFGVDRDAVKALLEQTVLRDHSITAIGKSEWSEMRWRQQSIAIKRDLVNEASVVFTASKSPEKYRTSRASLTSQGVNHRLLDCSDAHTWADSEESERIGNCWTWICAQPTLAGLRHAITEFDHRVFVGSVPPKLEATRLRPADHVQRILITKADDAPASAQDLFDAELELNPGFVAILGNKGKGKSALLDTIALVGDCTTESDFTFLSGDRFRNPSENRAKEHIATLTWFDGSTVTKGLDEHVDPTHPARLTYIPQRLLDEICSADPGEPSAQFSRELGSVLFAHVSQADRLGKKDLQALIDERSGAIDARMAAFRQELSTINRQIVDMEQASVPAVRSRLETQLAQLESRLNVLLSAEPEIPPLNEDIDDQGSTELDALKDRLASLVRDIDILRAEDAALAREIDAGDQLRIDLETLIHQWEGFVAANGNRLESLGLSLEDVASLTVELSPIDGAVSQRRLRRASIASSVSNDADESLVRALSDVTAELREAEESLDEPARLQAEAEAAHARWREECNALTEGSDSAPGIAGVQEQILQIDQAPARLAELKLQRLAVSEKIHASFLGKVAIFEELYEPARRFIDQHPLAALCQLSFGAGLRETDLDFRLFDIISRGAVGTFSGRDEGSAQLASRLESVNFLDASSVMDFLTELEGALHEDRRTYSPASVELEAGLRKGHTLEELYDLVFGLSYIQPHHSLRYRSTELDQLSPGEKGTILLMFYLLVDPSRTPLLLDQPDENLDNQTIKDLLVPAIKEAATRRQVIVVTHNPNVAVVADADQLIVADRQSDRFVYSSGAIEDSQINKDVVDVLEGTWPAFQNRQVKYQEP
jgi:ABC-type lipoprotein export system ATPase subunit